MMVDDFDKFLELGLIKDGNQDQNVNWSPW